MAETAMQRIQELDKQLEDKVLEVRSVDKVLEVISVERSGSRSSDAADQ